MSAAIFRLSDMMQPPVSAQSETCQSDDVDEYPLEDMSETDLVNLSDETRAKRDTSSTYMNTLCSSKPELDHSSLPVTPTSDEDRNGDRFNDDVDWDTAYTLVGSTPTMTSPPSLHNAKKRSSPSEEQHPAMEPFVRPPFPTPASTKAQLPGISSRSVLRTCFRIGEMINQTIKCHNQQQDVVFELYARVKQSERETTSRQQYFLLTDLYKTRPPFPRGTLKGWRPGSQLDEQASSFLGLNAEAELCWCLCKPNKDPRASIGWTYIFLSMRAVTWDDIQQAKLTILGARETKNGSGVDNLHGRG